MVDARVIPTSADTTATAVPLSCTVHYVETTDGLRYCVVPPEKFLGMPGEKPLPAVAEEQRWARGRRGPTPCPDGSVGQKRHFPVHLGNWPSRWFSEEERAQAQDRLELANQLEPEKWASAYREQMKSHYEGLMEGRRRGREIARHVDGASVLPAPEGLGAILQSGRFEVTGTVYFRPLRPFDPDPVMPEADDRFLSRYQIEYVYPRDSRS